MTVSDEIRRIGETAGGRLAEAMGERAEILRLGEAAEAAVLRPAEPGAWSHALRAALAARIARLHGLDEVAAGHAAAAGDDPVAVLGDPSQDGSAQGLGPVVAFMDRVAAATRDVTAEDVAALQQAGVADADIVRLCELNAFLAYQYRVLAGLNLLSEGA